MKNSEMDESVCCEDCQYCISGIYITGYDGIGLYQVDLCRKTNIVIDRGAMRKCETHEPKLNVKS